MLIIAFAILKYMSYGHEWIRALFVLRNGGFNVYHKNHQFSSVNGGGYAEKQVGQILSKQYGKQIEFQDERSALGKRADLLK